MYSLGDADGIQTRFLGDLDAFIEHITPSVDEFPDEFPPGFLKKASDIAHRGAYALATESKDEAYLIDRIVDQYWDYCGSLAGYRKKCVTQSMRKLYRYANELTEVLPAISAKASTYYRRIFQGSSLVMCGGHKYHSEDGVFHLSWLLPHQVTEFLSELAPYEAQLKSHNDESAGVLLVFEALKAAQEHGTSLVIVIA